MIIIISDSKLFLFNNRDEIEKLPFGEIPEYQESLIFIERVDMELIDKRWG
jgi:hypothetical protein